MATRMKAQLDEIGQAPSRRRGRPGAVFRGLLGHAQMFCAAVALVVLVTTGLNTLSIAAAALATGLTLCSLLVFRDWWWKRK